MHEPEVVEQTAVERAGPGPLEAEPLEGAESVAGGLGPQSVLALQRSAGNVAVQRLLRTRPARTASAQQIQRQGWYRSSFPTAAASLEYHHRTHGQAHGKSREEYTKDAEAFYAANSDKGVTWALKDGTQGIKIKGQPGGIFTATGQIVTFWYD